MLVRQTLLPYHELFEVSPNTFQGILNGSVIGEISAYDVDNAQAGAVTLRLTVSSYIG